MEYTVKTQEYVTLNITNSVNKSCYVERRFSKMLTVDEFKKRLEMLTGGSGATMQLEVYDKNDKIICTPQDTTKPIGFYPIEDGMRVHVIDDSIPRDEDLETVEKFEISEEEYAKRPDTVKAFLEKNKLGKYNEEETKRKEEECQRAQQAEEALVNSFKVGDRCETQVYARPKRRGTIMYLGKLDDKQGLWVGVRYDEPHGKNDGSINGKRYFECPLNYGSFVKPSYVKVGDFPEETFDLDEEI